MFGNLFYVVADGSSGVAAQGVLSKAAGAFDTVFKLASKTIGVITDNELLLVFFASGLLGISIGLIRKIKRA